MDPIKQSLYLISNANGDIYGNNTLVDFKNKLPFEIELGKNEGAEIALSFLGISNNFKNIPTPPNGLPSFFIITNCDKQRIIVDESGAVINIPVEFNFETRNVETGCRWFEFIFEDKYYLIDEIKEFFKKASIESDTNITYTDDMKLIFKNKPPTEYPKPFWVLMHKTMINCFNFINLDITGKNIEDRPEDLKVQHISTANQTSFVVRKVYYKDQLYYAYYIENYKNESSKHHFLESGKSEIKKQFPSVIRVICNNITPQIYNNTYSKDLVVFCPDFSKNDDFSATEFANKQYVPISNTTINEISIKLVDQNNEPIQLLPGPATILKMDLRLRRNGKKSFNVRLTSDMISDYPDNNNSFFRIKLPAPIIVNRDWRVALTSISHPNLFSTFLENDTNRAINFMNIPSGQNEEPKTVTVGIPYEKNIYTKQEIIDLLDGELKLNQMGSATLKNGKCNFKFHSDLLITSTDFFLKILGYEGKVHDHIYTRILFTNNPSLNLNVDETVFITKDNDSSYEVRFQNDMNLDYLKPNYIIVYTDIVSKTIIGGRLSNILKIVPIKSNNTDTYVISDFKHKEYYELQNTEITSIEINLRSHDGELVNFATNQSTILNLEFSNYYELIG